MKKLVTAIAFIVVSSLTMAQTTTENYIKNTTYRVQTTTGNVANDEKIESLTYFDGLGRAKQNVAIRGGGNLLNNNLINWKDTWALGSGSAPFFNQNGSTSENERIMGTDPYGNNSLLWRCGNDSTSDADGGWNTVYMAVDNTKTYRYTVWVKRTGSQDGYTYHGTQNVNTLSGSPHNNPYFWVGDLPNLDQWYLMVGVVHPHDYSGGDTGVSGVYDTNGNKVLDGGEFKWASTTTTSRFRNYLYYCTDTSVRQYFSDPILQRLDGNEASIADMVDGHKGKDIVTHLEYDTFGRQNKEYLPFAESTNGGNYRTDALTATNNFYNVAKYENTTNPFSEKELEASPLNRALKQAAPGYDWRLGGGNEIEFDYQTNSAADNNVRVYGVSLSVSGSTFTPTLTGGVSNYATGSLYKTITKDENHSSGTAHTTEEFKDKQGRVVLKRTYGASDLNMDGDTADTGESNAAHDTYYVYDHYGNLTYVLPPKMEASTQSLATVTSKLNDLGYQYKYDDCNRLIEKRIPGKDWEYIVYDELDRPVMTQDANLRALKRWLFTKYDAFGRVAYTGLYTHTTSLSQANMQAHFNGQNNTAAKMCEAKVTSGTGYDNSYYNCSNFPNTNVQLYTVNYYDDYNFDKDSQTLPASWDGQTIINHDDTNKSLTKGLATGSRVKVLSTSNWITTVTGYDPNGRAVYIMSKNSYLGTTDVVKNTLDFSGAVKKTVTDHDLGTTSIDTEDLFTYDHMGRLKTHTQELNNTNTIEVIVENHYDDMGQLLNKNVGGKTTQGRLQHTDFTYNIRGWLKQINDPNNLANDLFGFKINYNTVGYNGTALYNGNIAETEWKTANTDDALKWYKYTYDALNRINSGTDVTGNYNLTSIAYDKNGNITALERQGHINENATSFGIMDNLSYIYSSGNNLLSVTDSSLKIQGFNDGNTSGNDYSYDGNGNMTVDDNKNIDIIYNHLNLPLRVHKPSTVGGYDGGSIDYVYDATGVKLAKIVSRPSGIGNNVTNYFYAGNYVYKLFEAAGPPPVCFPSPCPEPQAQLQFFNHPEGYVDAENGYAYVYQYKDHLGNVRLSYKDGDNDGIITGEYSYTSVFSDDMENSPGWNSQGALSGSSATIDATKSKTGSYSAKIEKLSSGSMYASSNEWTYINNSSDTKHIFSGWVYSDSSTSFPEIWLIMLDANETGYFTSAHSVRANEKNKWAYIEGQVTVPSSMVKINLVLKNLNGNGTVWFDDVKIVRADPTNSSEILEENNYYPFGLKHKGYNTVVNSSNKALDWKYNDTEYEETLGLSLYEMDWRQYDPAIGRFNGIDRFSELVPNITPYRFAFNNPIKFSDPTGLFETRKEARRYRRNHNLKGGRIIKQDNGNFALVGKNGMHFEAGDDTGFESSDLFPNDGVIQFAYAGKPKSEVEPNWVTNNYTPLPGLPTAQAISKHTGGIQGVSVSAEYATPIRNPINKTYGRGITFGYTEVAVSDSLSSTSIRAFATGKAALEPGIAAGISIDFFWYTNYLENKGITAERLRGIGSESGASFLIFGGSMATDGHPGTEDGGYLMRNPTYRATGVSLGLGIDGYTNWTTNTRVSGN